MDARYEKLNPYLTHNNKSRVSAAVQWVQGDATRALEPGLSIVILNLNKPDLIVPLIETLVQLQGRLKQQEILLEIIIGDTGSTDPQVKSCYEKFRGQINVGEGLKYHFSRNNNEMFAKYVTRDLVLFMNNDIIFRTDPTKLFCEMIQRFEKTPQTAIIGATLLYDDLRVQHHGIDFFYRGALRGLSYHPGHREEKPLLNHSQRPFWMVPAVTGAFLGIRSELFRQLGGFDGDYRTECQDIDLCLMAKNRGFKIELMVTDEMIHLENATREKGSEDWVDRQKFVRQWSSFVEVMFE